MSLLGFNVVRAGRALIALSRTCAMAGIDNDENRRAIGRALHATRIALRAFRPRSRDELFNIRLEPMYLHEARNRIRLHGRPLAPRRAGRLPQHSQVAPEIERSIIYSVARTESAFDQRDKSAANAVGLMQVTPEAGRDTAKRFKISYDWDRMVSDPVYNTQMGAAELSALLSEYKGSHIMTFAGYNAGRGRVRDWIKAYGDPRDPKVDAVDWVERIPFSETRNYVQRVIENLAVYRVRFDGSTAVAAKTDARIATKETNAAPMPATGPAQ